jgi:hypothetical protein
VKLFKKPIKKYLLKELETNQEEWIDILNEKIDIPKLEEDEEDKLLTQIYDALQEAIEIAVDRI